MVHVYDYVLRQLVMQYIVSCADSGARVYLRTVLVDIYGSRVYLRTVKVSYTV